MSDLRITRSVPPGTPGCTLNERPSIGCDVDLILGRPREIRIVRSVLPVAVAGVGGDLNVELHLAPPISRILVPRILDCLLPFCCQSACGVWTIQTDGGIYGYSP